MGFSTEERAACERLIQLALQEDLGEDGDLTCQALIPTDLAGRAAIVARAPGVVAGLDAAQLAFHVVEPRLIVKQLIEDGTPITPGLQLATVEGPMRGILSAERTALNFLQRLSGIATLTATYVAQIQGLSARLLDTRKTTPGWRRLEKYAVRQGGGSNHRLGLYDGVLIKDNHLAALEGSIEQAIQKARQRYADRVPLEVEVDTLDQLDVALGLAPDVILLDNFTIEQLREAVRRRDVRAKGILLEASGGITLESIRPIALTGVDRISVGALTHGAKALDVALDYAT